MKGTRWLMLSRTALMAVLGLLAIFVPAEALEALGGTVGGYPDLLVQLTGALYLGFAMLKITAAVAVGALVYLPFATWFGWVLFRAPASRIEAGDR